VKVAEVIEVCWVIAKSSPVSVSAVPGCDVVAILVSGFPVLKKKSAAAGNGITTAAKVSAAIPTRAFDGMSVSSVMIFLRRHWEDNRRQ
jgi:hypothetical protein